MKIALRAIVQRWTLHPAGPRPETARRRSITFSPSGSATVVLHARPVAGAPVPALVATA
jgi:hypothetical protein